MITRVSILLRLVRYPNLLIIIATMYLLEYFLMPACALSHFGFFLYTLVPVTAAAAGYVINDIADRRIDLVNKPERTFVGVHISTRQAWILYFILVAAGLALTSLLVFTDQCDRILLYIFLVSTFLLAAYPYIFKPTPLLGNLLVALLSAMIPGLIVVNNMVAIAHIPEETPCGFITPSSFSLLAGYLFLAFYTSLIRELVKDMEDVQGDRHGKRYTLPVLAGITASKIVTWIIIVGFPLLICIPSLSSGAIEYFLLFVIFMVSAFPFFYVFAKARTRQDFTLASRYLKISMLAGLLAIPVLHYLRL